MADAWTEIGRGISHARNVAGLTQMALARQARVGRSTLVNIERGTRRASVEVLARICIALSLTDSQKAELLDLAAGEVVGG